MNHCVDSKETFRNQSFDISLKLAQNKMFTTTE